MNNYHVCLVSSTAASYIKQPKLWSHWVGWALGNSFVLALSLPTTSRMLLGLRFSSCFRFGLGLGLGLRRGQRSLRHGLCLWQRNRFCPRFNRQGKLGPGTRGSAEYALFPEVVKTNDNGNLCYVHNPGSTQRKVISDENGIPLKWNILDPSRPKNVKVLNVLGKHRFLGILGRSRVILLYKIPIIWSNSETLTPSWRPCTGPSAPGPSLRLVGGLKLIWKLSG